MCVNEPAVIYEDNHVLALCKPPGMPSQGDATTDVHAVSWAEAYLRRTYDKPGNVYVGLIHRLDRPVGGVLLLAKTSKAAARLSKAVQARDFHKTYLAVSIRVPAEPQGVLRHYLAKLPGKNIVRAYDTPAYGAQLAELSYELLAAAGGMAVLRVRPITGRQHQIRVQLARIGCGLVGDVKYCRTTPLPSQHIALWAYQLRVPHPVQAQPLDLTAQPPREAEPWCRFGAQVLG